MDPSKEFGLGGLNRFVQSDTLTDQIGLDAEEIAWRKEFIGFDEEDVRRLNALEPVLRENQEAIADAFYENLTQYDQTVDVISRSPKGVDQLKRTQKAYLVSLATGDYDEEYFTTRARIGKLHELLDMPLKHYVGQYGLYYDLILSRVDERVQGQVVDAIEEWAAERDDEGGLDRIVGALGSFGSDGDDEDGLDDSLEETVRDAIHDGMEDVLAVLRILNLDLQVASDTYVDSYSQRLQRAIERQRTLADEVRTDVKPAVLQLQETAEDVAGSATTIYDHADAQADNVADAAADIEEVSAASQEVASVAADVEETSERAAGMADQGVEAGERALAVLESLDDQTDGLLATAEAVEKRTEAVEEVVADVDDFVDRLSILEKKAKAEADRVTGDGPLATIARELDEFVVETEADLDELAEATAELQSSAVETRKAVATASTEVHEGREAVESAVDSLEGLEGAVEDSMAGMEEVAAAADQQARNVTALSATVEELAEAADAVATEAESVAGATEEQAAGVRQVAGAVEKLSTDPVDEETPVYEQV